MYNATLYFKKQLDEALIEAMRTEDAHKFAELTKRVIYLKWAIYALERLEEQDANK
jgi:hypothetical protein